MIIHGVGQASFSLSLDRYFCDIAAAYKKYRIVSSLDAFLIPRKTNIIMYA